MNRTEKDTAIAGLQKSFQSASVALIAVGQGLDVPTVQKLRRALRKADGEFKIAKNTLARLAIKDTPFSKLEPLFKGPTGIVFGYSDPVAVAKVLVKFTTENDKFSIRAGILDKDFLEADAVKSLAELPPREVLLSQLLSLLNAPATQLVRLLNEPAAQVARVIDAVRQRLENS